MFHENYDAIYKPKFIFVWLLLAIQGGFLNAAGFLGVGRFVSHLTGFATLFGVEAAKSNWPLAIALLSTPIFFLFGAIFSAWFIERRLIKNKRPLYSFVFSYIVLWLIIVLIAGWAGGFGEFGNHLDSYGNFFYLFTLAFICGLQNAMVSSATANIVRTTHLTGPTTDLGIGLVRVWSYRRESLRKKEYFATYLRLGIVISFVFGSLIGGVVLPLYQYKAFVIPILISTYSSIRLLK